MLWGRMLTRLLPEAEGPGSGPLLPAPSTLCIFLSLPSASSGFFLLLAYEPVATDVKGACACAAELIKAFVQGCCCGPMVSRVWGAGAGVGALGSSGSLCLLSSSVGARETVAS